MLAGVMALGGCGGVEGGCELQVSSNRVTDFDGDTFALWRGFNMNWTYNHRWNRMGSWVEETTTDDGLRCADQVFAAASGSGFDVATSESGARVLRVLGLGIVQQASRLEVTVYEGVSEEWVTASLDHTVEIDLTTLPDSRARAIKQGEEIVAVLNGFDLGAIGAGNAGKPIEFVLQLGEPTLSSDKKTLSVPVTGTLDLSCTTLECGLRIDPTEDVQYFVTTQVLVLSGDKGELTVLSSPVAERSYEWDAPPGTFGGSGTNPDARPVQADPSPLTTTQAKSIFAITGVDMKLSQWNEGAPVEQHMLTWHSSIHDEDEPEADLMFKNWWLGMEEVQPLSYPETGAVDFKMSMLELSLAQITDIRWPWDTEVNWDADKIGSPADGEAAESRWSERGN